MKGNGRHWVLLMALIMVAISLPHTRCEGASPAVSLQALYEAAKAEGEFNFWGPSDPDEMNALAAAFNKKFPGVKIKNFEITGGQLVQRIITEAQMGKVSADAAQGNLSIIGPLLERNLIEGYDDWRNLFQGQGSMINPNAILYSGKVLSWYHLSYPIGYNTKLLRREELPKTWEDLLDPKWKGGKIILESRGIGFSYLGLKWGEEKMVDYLRSLVSQKPLFSKGGTTTIQQLAAGEAPLSIGGYGYKLMWYARDKKAPVDFIDTISPVGASNIGNFVLKGAKHPNAAKLFIGWLVTPEALGVMEQVSMKGLLIPGSETAEYKRFAKNNVELLIGMPESSKLSEQLEKKAAEAFGAIR